MTPPPRVVVIDHHDSYVWNLVHLVAAVTGAVPDVVQHDATTAAQVLAYDRVVLSPGPDARTTRRTSRSAATSCSPAPSPSSVSAWGCRAWSRRTAGCVERIEPAHGDVAAVCHDGTGLFAGIPSPYPAVRYHSLAATRVPAELVVTAQCRDAERGSVVMGVRHRHLPLHGVQFHPESVLSEHGVRLIENFLRDTR